MSLRTIEQLSDHISNDLAWRKKELSEIKALIETRRFSSQRHRALVRSGILILYAHWEGFIKSASRYYLEYVSLLVQRSRKRTAMREFSH